VTACLRKWACLRYREIRHAAAAGCTLSRRPVQALDSDSAEDQSIIAEADRVDLDPTGMAAPGKQENRPTVGKGEALQNSSCPPDH